VPISPGSHPTNTEIQAALNAHGTGTTFCFGPGTYRFRAPLTPKSGQRLIGPSEGTAVFSGAKVVDAGAISQSGSLFVVSGQTQEVGSSDPAGGCRAPAPYPSDYKGCLKNDQVFLDGDPLWQVERKEDLVRPTEFWMDNANDRIYLGTDPRGKRLEVSVAVRALVSIPSNVTVKGLVIEEFANPMQTGAISSGQGWIVRDNVVKFNNGVGIYSGAHNTVKGNNIHHNGQMGLTGQGAGILIEDNEIAYNNINGANWAWEGGGSKWVRTTGLIVRGNHSHHNQGPGLWTDIENIDTVYEDNLVEHNLVQGIIHEISYDAIIRNNTVRNNGFGHPATSSYWGAGIEIWQSPNVEVYGNLVENNAHGIMAMMTPRGSGAFGTYELRNLFVHDNTIKVTTENGRSGLATYGGSGNEFYTSKNNRFRDNNYTLKNVNQGLHFKWSPGYITAGQWKAAGNDSGGSFQNG
jgi:parallel beta-helix repeat protein